MNFKVLGLTGYEEKAYTSLIRLGKATASIISRDSGVSYGKIYEVLGSLESKGFVRVFPGPAKQFVPTDPESLSTILDEKERELLNLREGIKKLKQVYDLQEQEVVETAKGKKSFYKIVEKLENPKTFSYSIRYTSEPNPLWMQESREHSKKKVDQKQLVRYDSETKTNVQKWLKLHKNIRALDNDGVAMALTDSHVLIALIKSNTNIVIRDKPFIHLMRKLFLATYEQAGKIEYGK